MSRHIPVIILLGVLAFAVGCTNKKVNNPLANVGSKQPDKVLFDRAMDAMKHNRFDVARITLQTLINTYPDSEYIARAKLAVADSWYAEGGGTALAQAEIEYKDFETFFPNMPEAAEAQLKIANIHYQQMEKPDRDYTHAMRAEEEYRQLILQYPDNKKVVAEGKQRLLEVQEVIAEREYRVGRFYFLRQSYPASIARLRTLMDKYPLYSKADEALYLLGQAYEGEIAMLRSRPGNEVYKARMIEDFTKNAADAYSRILTRYPLMDRTVDAKARLEALHQPVPRPTKAALAQNKAEEESRREASTVSRLMGNFQKHPDVAQAARVGEPPLVDPQVVSATSVVQEATRAMMGGAAAGGKNSVAIETVGKGALAPDQPAPRSDTPVPETAVTPADNPAPAADSNELKPNVAADPNELKPNVDNSAQTAPPPTQVNEIDPGTNGQAVGANGNAAAGASATADDKDIEAATSSSKHKKKKGLHKVIPF
ncbi:MAG: outer membrane protein assembly factor BamD [Acidobacteriia bacterium]|nr:outer membrane protein assembly factor BamD [Terriglobia bacterium]